MRNVLVTIGGPRCSGVTSVVSRLIEWRPDFHRFNMEVCAAVYLGNANGGIQDFERYLEQTIALLPPGITIVDWGRYATRNQSGGFEPFVSARCIGRIVNLPTIEEMTMIRIDVDTFHLSDRRAAAPYLNCMQPASTDLVVIDRERMAEHNVFGEYVDELCPRRLPTLNMIRKIDNVYLDVAARQILTWIEAMEEIKLMKMARVSRPERMVA